MIRGVTFLEGDILYSFTISVHLISGLIRGVTSLEGDILYYFTISVHLISGLIRGVTSLEGDILYYFTISVHLISGLIRGVMFGGSGLIRGGLLYNSLTLVNVPLNVRSIGGRKRSSNVLFLLVTLPETNISSCCSEIQRSNK